MRIKTILILAMMVSCGFVNSVFADDKAAIQKGLDQYGIRKMTPAEEAQAKKDAEAKASSAPTTSQVKTQPAVSNPATADTPKSVSPEVQKGLDQFGIRKMTPEEEAQAKKAAEEPKTPPVPMADQASTPATRENPSMWHGERHDSLVGEVDQKPGDTPGRWIYNFSSARRLDENELKVYVTNADGSEESFHLPAGEWAWIPDGAKSVKVKSSDSYDNPRVSVFEGDPKYYGHPDQRKHFKMIDSIRGDREDEIIIKENGKIKREDDEEADSPDHSSSRDTQFNGANTWERPDQKFNLGFSDTIDTLSRNFGTPVQEAQRDQK